MLDTSTPRGRTLIAGALLLSLTPLGGGGLRAQGSASPPSPEIRPPLDTASLATGPYSTLSTLYEKTIFQVDAARVHIRFGPETASRLRALVAGEPRTDALADSAARIAIRAPDAFAEIELEHGLSLDDYLEITRENMDRAREAGFLTTEEVARISRGLPDWYAPLRDRGMKEGDRLLYRIRGDSLRTVLVIREGRKVIDLVHHGPERGRAVLGGFLAPGTDFRKGLLTSLFDREGGSDESREGTDGRRERDPAAPARDALAPRAGSLSARPGGPSGGPPSGPAATEPGGIGASSPGPPPGSGWADGRR